MSYCECPYCGHNCGDYFDDCHEQDVEYEHECENCEKNFIFTISYYPSFTESKAPCLNGEGHKFSQICGVPEEAFKDKYKCDYCGKEETIKKDALQVNNEKGGGSR